MLAKAAAVQVDVGKLDIISDGLISSPIPPPHLPSLPALLVSLHIRCRGLLCEHQARGRSGLEVILGRDPELLALDFGRVGRSAEHESASFYTRHYQARGRSGWVWQIKNSEVARRHPVRLGTELLAQPGTELLAQGC